jgi:hypothetical protein
MIGRRRRDEVAALEQGDQRVLDERVGLPENIEHVLPGGSGREDLDDVDEQPSAAHFELGPAGRELEKRQPQRLHRVGHHLLVADGHVHVPLAISRIRDRVQRRDGPALDDVEAVFRPAPFDVLRMAEVRFDRSADFFELYDLVVGQRSRALPPVDDRPVPHFVDVGVHVTGDQRVAEAEDGVDGRDAAVAGDRIGGEEDAGGLGDDHPLDDHGDADLPRVEAVLPAVGDGPIREERCPALADALQDLLRADDVQVRVLLAGERRRRQILRRRARAHGVRGAFVGEAAEGARDLVSDVLGDGGRFDRTADLGGG